MSSDAKKMTKDFRREKKQLDEEKNKLILNLRIVSEKVKVNDNVSDYSISHR